MEGSVGQLKQKEFPKFDRKNTINPRFPKMAKIFSLLDKSNTYCTSITLSKKELLDLKVDEWKEFCFKVSMIKIRILIFRKISLLTTEKSIANGEDHFQIQAGIVYPKHIKSDIIFRLSLKGRQYDGSLYYIWGNKDGYVFKQSYSTVSDLLKTKEEEDSISVKVSNHNFSIVEAEYQTMIYDKLTGIENMLLELKEGK